MAEPKIDLRLVSPLPVTSMGQAEMETRRRKCIVLGRKRAGALTRSTKRAVAFTEPVGNNRTRVCFR